MKPKEKAKKKKGPKIIQERGKMYQRKFYLGDKGVFIFTTIMLYILTGVIWVLLDNPPVAWVAGVAATSLLVVTISQGFYWEEIRPDVELLGGGVSEDTAEKITKSALERENTLMKRNPKDPGTLKTVDWGG